MYLTYKERQELSRCHHGGMSNKDIALRMGRHPSTISRELSRNKFFGTYDPYYAHRKYMCRKIFVGRKSVTFCNKIRLRTFHMDKFVRRITQWLSDYFDDYLRCRRFLSRITNYNLCFRYIRRTMKFKGPLWYGFMAKWILNLWDKEEAITQSFKESAEELEEHYRGVEQDLNEIEQKMKKLHQEIDELLDDQRKIVAPAERQVA